MTLEAKSSAQALEMLVGLSLELLLGPGAWVTLPAALGAAELHVWRRSDYQVLVEPKHTWSSCVCTGLGLCYC